MTRRAAAALAALVLVAPALAGCASPDGEDTADGSADTARAAAAGDTVRSRTVPDTGPATAGAAACPDTVARASEEEAMEDSAGSRPSIHEVLDRHRDAWMGTAGVIGTGVGRCDGDPCLVIYLRDSTDELEAELPDCAEGYPVRLERTGTAPPPDAPPGGPDRGS